MTEKPPNDEIIEANEQLNEKIIENENYKQELYNLRHKLNVCLATQKDLTIANEAMEERLSHQEAAMEMKTNLLSEKFTAEKKQYEEKISELEASLLCEEKRNGELKDSLNAKEKLLIKFRNEEPDKTQENLMLKKKIDSLVNDLENREKTQREFLSRQQQLEEANNTLQKNYNDIRDILQAKKEDLASLNEILETTRDELVVCRSELEALKAVPASDSMKGNSLFAEVEDNRRKLINDMISLKKKYLYMKENFDSKDKEIRALQAERAALLMKLQDETVGSVDRSAHLIETYKSRIWELENRLKMEEKKLKMNEKNKEQQVDNSFSYLQSVITGKKKEIEELCNKLEESSIQKILHEEMKYEIEKQLKQWRYKAMSYQAQLLAAENQPKCDQCLKLKPKDSGDSVLLKNTERLDCQSEESSSTNSGVDRGDSTLEKLLQIPKASAKDLIDSTDNSILEDLGKSEENEPTVQLGGSMDMEETLPVAESLWQRKSIPDRESDKENIPSASNADRIILKSSLVKSEDKSQEKSQKSLRFTPDTVDIQKPKLTRQEMEKKSYPIVFISSNQLKK